MKRKLFLFSLAVWALIGSVQAQLAGSELFNRHESSQSTNGFKKNCFGLDFGVGSVKDGEGTEFDFGMRWLHNFSPYIGWDVIGIKAVANTKDVVASATPQAMTGIRGTSPILFANMTAYAGFRMGYGYNVDSEIGGLCYEFSFGINLTKKIYIGYAYNYQGGSKDEENSYTVGKKHYTETITREIKQKYHAFRIGFNF